MKKEKVNPKKPPLKDIQGHTYQHEIGDPDAAEKISPARGRSREGYTDPEATETPHAMKYQTDKARSGKPANVKIPRKRRSK